MHVSHTVHMATKILTHKMQCKIVNATGNYRGFNLTLIAYFMFH